MNIFEIFSKTEYDSKNVLIKDCSNVTLESFKKCVAVAIEYLNLNTFQKNIVLLSENTFDFTVWFFACVYSGREIYFPADFAKLRHLTFDYVVLDKFDFNLNDVFSSELKIEFKNVDFEKVFLNFYTSGSSGVPKHIRKNLKNAICEANIVLGFLEKSKTDCVVVKSTAKPLHMFAFVFYFILPLIAFDKLILDTDRVYYPDNVDFDGSVFVSTPSFLEKFRKYQIPCSAGIIFSAGAKLNKELVAYFEKKSYVVDIYGSTESGTIAYRDSAFDEYMSVFPSVNVSVDSFSQICVESPFFIERKLVLGDVIEMKDENHFLLLNRSDRILKIQEKRVSASEIESLIDECEFVKESYCFKSFDKLACAVVVDCEKIADFLSKCDKTCFIKDIIGSLKKHLTDKTDIVPQRWRFLHELPKTVRGKVDGNKLEQIFATNLSLPFVLSSKIERDFAEYEMFFPLSCNFFKGHFDGFPVLPGVVQMYYANYFAANAFDVNIRVDNVKKIKFSKIINPDERVKLVFERKNNIVNYKYERDGQLCSNGVMYIDEKD